MQGMDPLRARELRLSQHGGDGFVECAILAFCDAVLLRRVEDGALVDDAMFSKVLNAVLQYATASLLCRTRTTSPSILSISDNDILRPPACSPALIWPTRLSPVSRDLEIAASVSVPRPLRPAPSTVPKIRVRTRLGRTRVFGRFPLSHSLCSSPLFSAQDAAGRVSGLALPHSRWGCSPSGFPL